MKIELNDIPADLTIERFYLDKETGIVKVELSSEMRAGDFFSLIHAKIWGNKK